MHKIEIKSLSLLNFKGIRSRQINFGNPTIISGDNGTGKTSIFDAFSWLLFGKDSSNRADFNIKTLDANNNPIPQIDHEVSGVLLVNGKEINLKKCYKEKWVKKRGSELSEMTGHTTEYYINDVPYNEGQYKERISDIISENLFKLLTNVSYFNQMKWEERRAILSQIAGNVTNEEIATTNLDFVQLLNELSGKSIEDYKREIAKKKQKLKEVLDSIPTRIDEISRTMPPVEDYAAISQQIQSLKNEIQKLEQDRSLLVSINEDKNAEVKRILDEKLRLQTELMHVKNANKLKLANSSSLEESQIRAKNQKIETYESELSKRKNLHETLNIELNSLIEENDRQRAQWQQINSEVFVLQDSPTHCNTCKQPLPVDQIEEYTANAQMNFNTSKESRMNAIKLAGIKRAYEIDKKKDYIAENEAKINDVISVIGTMQLEVSKLQSIVDMLKNQPIEIDPRELELEAQINDMVIPTQIPFEDSTAADRNRLNLEIIELNKKLQSKEQIDSINKRIEELQDEQRRYSQELANLEKSEFTIMEFNRIKSELIESRVNTKFQLVKFRMFKMQVNGAQEECCDCMVNGVPYSDVNTAGKINAGIDIINALIEHNQTSAPVWIDNCESINSVLPTPAQTVLLYVTKENLSIN
jgi:DNA repair exonuclease SbcCD ATPase subunit